MTRERWERRLSSISTVWTMLRQASTGPPAEAAAAQQLVMERYGGAVRRYLRRVVGDQHTADDLTQEFALSLVRGQFGGADPQRGRFRDYVKAVLFHLVGRYRRQQKRQPRPLAPDSPVLGTLPGSPAELDRAFRESWRDHLLARAWEALADAQPVYYAVLRFRTANPDPSSTEAAAQLARQLGRPFTAEGFRQALHRARDRFADLLVEEVARTVEPPDLDKVEEELREQDLLAYCRPALERRRGGR